MVKCVREDKLFRAIKITHRVKGILMTMYSQWPVLATMTPNDFHAFRGALGSASGLQSAGYRAMEFLLGNKHRAMISYHAKDPEATAMLEALLESNSIYDEFLALLSRRGLDIPAEVLNRDRTKAWGSHPAVVAAINQIYDDPENYWDIYDFTEKLIDIDENISHWRYRHYITVSRFIGSAKGTGGSSGTGFLHQMVNHRFFPDIWESRGGAQPDLEKMHTDVPSMQALPERAGCPGMQAVPEKRTGCPVTGMQPLQEVQNGCPGMQPLPEMKSSGCPGMKAVRERQISQDMTETKEKCSMSYGQYLQLDKVLSAQCPKQVNPPAHDELLFIIMHQTKELWLKLISHEMIEAVNCLRRDELLSAVKITHRVKAILMTMYSQWPVLATMDPNGFKEFRGALGSATGFQSAGYRAMEFVLGNKSRGMISYHKQDAEASQLLEGLLNANSIYDEFLACLSRRGLNVPVEVLNRDRTRAWGSHPEVVKVIKTIYDEPQKYWDAYDFAERLVDIDESISHWRYRHYITVSRFIGGATGTGGSSGTDFLHKMVDHRFFPDLWEARGSLSGFQGPRPEAKTTRRRQTTC